MNSTSRSTPPNPSLDLPNPSTGLNKTLGTTGTPHEESTAKLNPTKTCPNKKNRRTPAKSTSNPRTRKTQNRAPLLTDSGGESQPKEQRRVPTNFPHQIPKSKVPKSPQENHQERAPKISTKNNREQHNKALRNHAESSIHTTKVHTRSSLPPDHPTLSQYLTMKLSS
jgi:hypothetical protein